MAKEKPVLPIALKSAIDKIVVALNEADIAWHEVFGLGTVNGILVAGRTNYTNLRAAEDAIRRAAIKRRIELHTPTAVHRAG